MILPVQDIVQRKKNCNWLLVSHDEIDISQLVRIRTLCVHACTCVFKLACAKFPMYTCIGVSSIQWSPFNDLSSTRPQVLA